MMGDMIEDSLTVEAVMHSICEANGGEDEARRKCATIGASLEGMAELAMTVMIAESACPRGLGSVPD